MDLNALMNPQVSEEEVQNHVLYNTLLEIGKASESQRKQKNSDAVDRINAAEAAGVYANTDMSGITKTSGNSIKASLDENGNVSITNIGTTPKKQMYSMVGATADEALTTENMDARIKAIQEESDTDNAVRMYGTLVSDFEVKKASLYNESLANAKVSQKIPELEAEVRRLQAIDTEQQRRNPSIPMGMSPATVQAMGLLEAANKNAITLATQSVETNIPMVSMSSKLESMNKTLEGTFAKKFNRDLQTQAKIDAKQAADEAKAASIPDETKARVRLANPTFSDVDVFNFINNKKVQSPDDAEAYLAGPQDLLKLSAIKGNKLATDFIIQKEVAAIGTTQEAATKDIKFFNNLLKDTATLKTLSANILGGTDSEAFKQVASAFNTATTLGTKEQQAAAQAQRLDLALRVMSQKRTTDFVNDAASWNVPELQDAITKTRTLNLPTTMDNVLSQYLGESIGADRTSKAITFSKLASVASTRYANSILGSVNSEAVMNMVASRLSSPSLLDKLSKIPGIKAAIPTASSSLLELLTPTMRAGQALQQGLSNPEDAQIEQAKRQIINNF